MRHARLLGLDALVDTCGRANRISEVHDVDLEWSAPRGDTTGVVVGG